MKCIACGKESRVMMTYQNAEPITRRRRKCMECDFRFTTREKPAEKDVKLAKTYVPIKDRNPLRPAKIDSLSQLWYNGSPSTDT